MATRLLVTLAVIALCAIAPAEDPPDLRLMSWNIQTAAFDDWGTRRTQGVWPTMIAEHADIMCLQEVMSQQLIQTLCHLRDHGLEYSYIGYGRSGTGVKAERDIREAATSCANSLIRLASGGEHCVILWNDDVYAYDPIDGVGANFDWDGFTSPKPDQELHTFWLTNEPTMRWKPGSRFRPAGPLSNSSVPNRKMQNASFYRICTWGRFRHRESGRHVYVYNAHLDHISQDSRKAAVRQILEHARYMSEETNAPVILAGDFNATPFSPEIRYITHGDTDEKDPFLDLSVMRMHNVSGMEPTYGADERRIDYVFTTNGFRSRGHRVVRPNGKSSDHRPVCVEIDFE